MASWQDLLKGTPGGVQQIPTASPQQIGAVNNLLPLLQSRLQSNLSQASTFDPIAQQARSQFTTQTIPSIAERFSALGSNRGASGFQGSLGAAAADLETNLAALRSQYGLQEQGNLNALLNTLLSPQFQNLQTPSQPGLIQTAGPQAVNTLLSGLTSGSSDNLGLGLSGAITGAGLGSTFGPVGTAVGAGVGASAPFWKWLIGLWNKNKGQQATLGIQGGKQ